MADFCPPNKDLVVDIDDFNIDKYIVSTTITEVKNPIKEGEKESSGSYHTAEILYEYDTEHGPVRAPLRLRVKGLRARRGITCKTTNGRYKEYCVYELLKTKPSQAKLIEVSNAIYSKTAKTLYCKKVAKILPDIGFDAEKPLEDRILDDPKKRWPCLWHPLMYNKDKTKITPESNPIFIAYLMKNGKKTNFLKAITCCVPCRSPDCTNDNHTRLPVHFPANQVRKIGFTGNAVILFKDLYFGGKCNKFRIELETFTIIEPEIITASTTEAAVIRADEKSGLINAKAYEEKMRLMEEANGNVAEELPEAKALAEENSKEDSDSSPEKPPSKKVVAPKKAKAKVVAPASGVDEFSDDEQ